MLAARVHGYEDHKLHLDQVPAGTAVRMQPAESLKADGTVDQASLMGGGGSRGADLFNTYLYSRSQSVMGGTSQIQKNIIAGRILRMAV